MDLAAPIRAALVGSATITSELDAYAGGYPIFTRRPVPTNAPYPMVVVSSGFQAGEEDGTNDQRPVLVRDIAVYGQNDTPAHYRQVETIAFAVHDLFHRKWRSITVSGWKVVGIRATAPAPAPTDEVRTVGRIVELTVRLAKAN